jgi:hypothetical protein
MPRRRRIPMLLGAVVEALLRFLYPWTCSVLCAVGSLLGDTLRTNFIGVFCMTFVDPSVSIFVFISLRVKGLIVDCSVIII